MGWMVTILLFSLWVLGLVSGAALGMWIHILLAFALVSLAVAMVRAASRRYAVR